MPFHLPHIGHRNNDGKKKDKSLSTSSSGSKHDKTPNGNGESAFVPVSSPRRVSSDSPSESAPSSSSASAFAASSEAAEANGHTDIPIIDSSVNLAKSPRFSPSVFEDDTASSPKSTAPHRPSIAKQRTSSHSSSQIQGILRNATSPSISGSSEYTFTSSSGSAFTNLHKRMSSLAFDRSDTIDSMSTSTYDDERQNSTPGTSVSSLNAHCPLPTDSDGSGSGYSFSGGKAPFFMMTLSSVSTLSFIALAPSMRPMVMDAVNRAWKRGIGKITEVDYQPELMKKHKDRGCEGGVWEITMKGEAWMPSSAEQVSSKRVVLNLLTEFAREGYGLTSSFRTSAKDSGKDTLIFSAEEPDPEPVFFAVAFYSHDRIWIIDAEADVGESLEEGIKKWWTDGIRDARVRERHCREIRLRGAPWTAHSTTSLISARCIHLTIMKIVTHCQSGYDFVGSVDMADKEEGEMPVTFYRRKRAVGLGLV